MVSSRMRSRGRTLSLRDPGGFRLALTTRECRACVGLVERGQAARLQALALGMQLARGVVATSLLEEGDGVSRRLASRKKSAGSSRARVRSRSQGEFQLGHERGDSSLEASLSSISRA